MELALAVDIGGTKLAAALVTRGGEVVAYATVPTPPATPSADGSPAGAAPVTAALREVCEQALEQSGGRPVVAYGVGSAGPVDLIASTVSPINIPGWRGFPILAALADLAPGAPGALAGDGHCMALGEYRQLPGGSSRSMLGIVVSTGVGGGIVLDGRLYGGPTGNAGHVGHMVVDFDGPACACGGRGCVEAIASGPSMVRWAAERGWSPARDGAADGRALADSARAGDAIASAAFARAGRAVAAAVASTAALVDLDDVIVGGGVAATGELLFAPLRAGLAEFAGMDFVKRVRVGPGRLGGHAGLLGAAAVAFDRAGVGTDLISQV